MTGQERLRKEQQRKIQRAIDDFYSNRPTERDSLGAALQNAFETLSSCSEIPNSSNLISRQAAIDAILAVTGNSSVRELYEHVQEHGLSEMWSGGVNAAIDIIIAVPPAQLERKKGKWIEVDDYYNRISGRCSICDWEALLYETDVVGMDYCPNCGADMRGDD